jgi:prepilin-type N-terminal cleavage/methylation domain-containing protein
MLTPRVLISSVAADASDDDGFTLIEVVIAMVVLAIFSAAVGVVLLDGLEVSKAGRQRVAAANLAAREIEIARNQFASSEAAAIALAATGAVSNPNPLSGSSSVVDGVPYTVSRTVQWLPTGNGASPCDGGSLVNHPSLRVQVSVTWPNMGFAKPVRSSTLLTPPKGLLGSTTIAFVAMKAVNAAGQGSAGVQMHASGPGGSFVQTTDSAGCAVFQVGAAGTYAVVADMAGWVDQTGAQRAEKSIVAQVGQLARGEMTYDRGATMDVTLLVEPGYGTPSSLPSVNYMKPNVPLSSARVVVPSAGLTTQISGLWPSRDGYSAWAGACNDSDPAGLPTNGSREAPVVLGPGQTGAVNARLAPVAITVTETSAGLPAVGAQVTAISQNCGSVPEGTLSLGLTDSAGELKSSLPFGDWVLSVTHAGDTDVTGTFSPLATGPTTVTHSMDTQS